MMKQKIALFHPWIKSRGGAEKVVLEILKKSKHTVHVYTWNYDPENTFEEFKKFEIHVLLPSFIAQSIARKKLLRSLFLPLSFFLKIPLETYDRFVISTSGLAEFINFRNYKKGRTYAYVYTPLREATESIIEWNLQNGYKKGKLMQGLYLLSTKMYRFFERRSWKRIDKVAFISQLSKKRALERKLITHKKTTVIIPPVEYDRFSKLKLHKGNTFVYYSRLNPPKRQDLLIQAWKSFVKKYPQMHLAIIGTIENKDYYEQLEQVMNETKNVTIQTNATDKEIESHVAHCAAGIFLGFEEDFGIVPLEVLASGKPLLAVNKGGYVDLIKDHPQYFAIKEKQNKQKMIKEIEITLEQFMKTKKSQKKGIMKNTGNFIQEFDAFIVS